MSIITSQEPIRLPKNRKARVMEIVAEEAARAGLMPTELTCKNRNRKVAAARRIAMYRARIETGISMPQLGKIFSLDHSTVLYHLQLAEAARPKP